MYIVVKNNWQKGSFNDEKVLKQAPQICFVKMTDSSKKSKSRMLIVWLVEVVRLDKKQVGRYGIVLLVGMVIFIGVA